MLNRKIHSRKIWWWAGSLSFILLLFIGTFFYLSRRWKPVIEREIKEAILNSTDSLYNIDFSDIDVNLLTGSAEVHQIVFKPDRKVFEKLKVQSKAPIHLFQIEIDGLFLKHIHPWKIYFKRQLEMSSIVVERPRIKVFFENVGKIDSLITDERTAYQRLSKYLKAVDVGNIAFYEVDFQYIDKSYKKPRVDRVKNVEIVVKDLLIDSLSHRDKTRFYYTKDIAVNVQDHAYNKKDGMYTFRFKDFSASSAGGFVKLEGLKVIPRYADLEFSKKYDYQKDRFSVLFDEIRLNNIDFRKLNLQRRLVARSLDINNGDVSIFINRSMPLPPFDRGRNYPQLALKRLALNTSIDTILIRNANIRYTEYNPKTDKKGTVFFNNVRGSILNVSNDSVTLLSKKWSRASLSALFMGRGALNLKINFNLTDPKASFNYSGELGEFNLKALNPLTRPIALVEIKSGVIKKATFNVKANYNKARGTLKIYYEDLKVRILGINEENNKIKAKGLVSLVTNMLIIENSNPSPSQSLRIGQIAYTRPKSASFFNLMWKGIFSGVKESVGLSKHKEKMLKQRFQKLDGVAKKLNERSEGRKKKRELAEK
jgi:hypothetical protein